MQQLIAGLGRFQRQVVDAQPDFFARLGRGQQPAAMFICCSDSRVVPQLITQTAPGELFVLQNAGNIVPAPSGHKAAEAGGEQATIEYAVDVLGVQSIVLCGHTHCGAMAALDRPQQLQKLPAARAWLTHALPPLAADPALKAAERWGRSHANVRLQLSHLLAQPAVARAVAAGRLQVAGWVYEVDTGAVVAWSDAACDFVTVAAPDSPPG